MFVKCAVLVLVLVISVIDGQMFGKRLRRFPMRTAMTLKQRLQNKILQYRERNTQTICYEKVGCFELPHSRSPLQKTPESPKVIDTKFFLFRRDINFATPQILYYDDEGKSLNGSKFNHTQKLKLFIHGYMSNWNEKGPVLGSEAFLKLYDCNMILMDWSKGARGPQYATAAANTEVAGRQLGLLLIQMVEKGLDPKNIHLLGFSLGAHVAGTASEMLKYKGHLIGRITGLDAASPLFRSNHFREKYKKLDRSDAHFVDVIHTDSSPSVTDGFGLWEPIGHVDFFPNGGQEQPGCKDTKRSVVVSSLDKSLNRDIACSHIRAWHLYAETLLNKIKNKTDSCQFISYYCPGGLPSFEKGHCFPRLEKRNSSTFLDNTYRNEVGVFGEDVKGEGVMYFSTSSASPFCGTQLQASVQLSQNIGKVKGVLQLKLRYSKNVALFHIHCDVSDVIMTGSRMNGLAVAPHNSLNEKVENINASLIYYTTFDNANNNSITKPLYVDRIVVTDMYENSWRYCGKNTVISENKVQLTLSRTLC
ncbi:unnamed protein product [Brassicogethes aeneus]|uniref:Lipase domain-containing protein n=1 Tax=Brassicogethes aeneus TaxID=1431903 RepID=A0A9P0B6F5_BRAAE|nr:unnamed protein product [Brassicogethes aeneus]